jgi:hypothetical protein
MRKSVFIFLWLIIGTSVIFAQSASNTSQAPIQQKAYCERSGNGQGMGGIIGYHGVYVDTEGNLYSFRGNASNLPFQQNAKLTEKKWKNITAVKKHLSEKLTRWNGRKNLNY